MTGASECFLEGYQVLASLEGPKLDIKFWRIYYQILVISPGAPQSVAIFIWELLVGSLVDFSEFSQKNGVAVFGSLFSVFLFIKNVKRLQL